METKALQEFRQGIALLRNQYPEKALLHIRRAAEMESLNPFYLSYLGLLTAKAERRWADGEQLCETALHMRRTEAQLYLNLAEVCVIAGRRDDAADVLRRGLANVGPDHRLQAALSKVTPRRPPIIPFLGRGNFLNRHLGRWRHRMLAHNGA